MFMQPYQIRYDKKSYTHATTYVTVSDKQVKCGKDPSTYWQLWSTGKLAVTTGTCQEANLVIQIFAQCC